MKVWREVCSLVADDFFMKRFFYGHSRFLPLHLAFAFQGTSLVSVASNATVFGHAERNCVRYLSTRNIPQKRKSLTLIVVRITSNRTFGMSRPCRNCCKFLKRTIPHARVFYTDTKGTLIEDVCLDSDHLSLSSRPPR